MNFYKSKNPIHVNNQDGFFYQDQKNGEKDRKDRVYQVIRGTAITIIDYYLKDIITKENADEFFNRTIAFDTIEEYNNYKDKMISSINNSFRKVYDKFKGGIIPPVRFENEKCAAMLIFIPKNLYFTAILYIANDEKKNTVIYIISFNTENLRFQHNFIPFYHSYDFALYYSANNSKSARKRCLKEYEYITQRIPSDLEFMMVDDMLKFLADSGDSDSFPTLYLDYNKQEMMLYKKFIELLNPGYNSLYCHTINRLINDDYRDQTDSFDVEDIPDFITSTYSWREIPLIDFNQKEQKFCERYCAKNGLFGEDTKLQFNLSNYINDQRYGSLLKFEEPIYDDNNIIDSKLEILFNYELIDDNKCKIYLIEKINEYVAFDWEFCYTNIDKFNLISSLVQDEKIVVVVGSNIPTGYEWLSENSTLYNQSYMAVIPLLRRIISSLIVIHDRPKRTRMVRCTETRKEVIKERGKKKEVEQQYIISRVLRTVEDARSLVDSKEPGTRKYEYTIDSWERRGGLVHRKNGTVYYRNGTTCNRHPDLLTKKPIHVKL